MIPADQDRAPIKAFRIVKRRFAASAFSGEAARIFGGRWNSPGTSAVYTSNSMALAVLEWRVHLAQWPPPPVMIIDIEFPFHLVWCPPRLPSGWNRFPAQPQTCALGDNWFHSRRSAVLKVPSAIVPKEFNYLINPLHPDFAQVKIAKPKIFKINPRLGGLAS